MNRVIALHFKGFLWFLVFCALVIAVNLAATAIQSPDRSIGFILGTVFIMALMAPLYGIIFTIVPAIVFTIPLAMQALLVGALAHRLGRASYVVVVLVLPLTAILTWYCYDYLTPTIDPYPHGLTWPRYLGSLVAQALATGFTLLYYDVATHRASTKWFLVGALALTIAGALAIPLTLAIKSGWPV